MPAHSAITRVPVALGARAYEILIGEGLLETAGKHIAPLLPSPRVIIISDETVAARYAPMLEASLTREGIASARITVAPGEGSKNFTTLARVVEEALSHRPDRKTTILALGGGVIGDLAGFAASMLLRGVPFIQIPTTLLAQVDSSVGGKTGINTAKGKNLAGAFYQPRLVLADTGALRSLPEREFLAGYAEIVKYGLINQPDFFAWLEAQRTALLSGDTPALVHAIATSCRVKAAIVAEDETEHGARALLNLGHTFGHALEAEMGYDGRLLHGEAVAAGMVMAFDLSARLGLCPKEDAARVRAHIEAAGLPASARAIAPGISAEALLRHMAFDKKNEGAALTFILARGIGKAFVARDVAKTEVAAILRESV